MILPATYGHIPRNRWPSRMLAANETHSVELGRPRRVGGNGGKQRWILGNRVVKMIGVGQPPTSYQWCLVSKG